MSVSKPVLYGWSSASQVAKLLRAKSASVPIVCTWRSVPGQEVEVTLDEVGNNFITVYGTYSSALDMDIDINRKLRQNPEWKGSGGGGRNFWPNWYFNGSRFTHSSNSHSEDLFDWKSSKLTPN
jgi:hypothetical protein